MSPKEDSTPASDGSQNNQSCNQKSKLGRKGDPRMHRAVSARLANPSMTLLNALLVGGFQFPSSDTSKVLDTDLYDTEGVSLAQRKNQLSRRLRIARQASEQQHPTQNSIMMNNAAAPSSSVELGRMTQLGGKKRSISDAAFSDAGNNADNDADMEEEMAIMQNRLAKFHPSYHPLFPHIVHTNGSTLSNNADSAARMAAVAANLTATSTMTQTADAAVAAASNPASLATLLQQQQPVTAPAPTTASGAAVASLTSTAASAGLTLDQLAMNLSSTPSLLHVLSSTPSAEQKHELALCLYRGECRSALSKSMLLAGYSASDVADSSPTRLALAFQAWEAEGKRLEEAMGMSLEAYAAARAAQRQTGGAEADALAPGGAVAQLQQQGQQQQQQTTTTSQQSSTNSSEIAAAVDNVEQHSLCTQDGQHMHSLTGSCGHKPVLHQPEGRRAHIDFVVGSKLECYEGISPARGASGCQNSAIWPSRYMCIDLEGATAGISNDIAHNHSHAHHDGQHQQQEMRPKELPLSDIDFEGKEWNQDFFNKTPGQDDTLLGLMKLGDNNGSGDDKR